MLLALVVTIVGLALLVKAADVFVDGAANLAEALDVSPVVIGAVVVGFGTSAPEMLVSAFASIEGDQALGVGNIIGSNVANLSLVLGCAALLTLIVVDRYTRRTEVPLSVLATFAFAFVAVDGAISRIEGLALFAALAVVLTIIIRSDRVVPQQEDLFGAGTELEIAGTSAKRELGRALVGLVLTMAGAQAVVWGATDLADRAGLSDGFVGFSLVAVGTSLPELVTAITAARKGETELIVGNLLGSNIFNSLAVGGVIGLVGPGPVDDPTLTGFGLLMMLLVTVTAVVLMLIPPGVNRVRGAALLAFWVVAVVGLSGSDPADEDAAPSPPTSFEP